jgi:hypothetical protein
MNHFGFEIEAHISNKELLSKYLIDYSDSLNYVFGVDGAGISTIEVRSPVFNSIEEMETFLVQSMYKLKKYKPNYNSIIIKRIGNKFYVLTNSIHISLDIDENINWKNVSDIFYKKYLVWLFRKNFASFIRYNLRRLVYPKMVRLHEERIEFRFFSSEYPLSSIKFIRDIIGESNVILSR